MPESRRTARSAPPWPATWQYVFSTDEGKTVPELDAFSAKRMFPGGGLAAGAACRIVCGERTNVIVRIETVEAPAVTVGD